MHSTLALSKTDSSSRIQDYRIGLTFLGSSKRTHGPEVCVAKLSSMLLVNRSFNTWLDERLQASYSELGDAASYNERLTNHKKRPTGMAYRGNSYGMLTFDTSSAIYWRFITNAQTVSAVRHYTRWRPANQFFALLKYCPKGWQIWRVRDYSYFSKTKVQEW